MKILPLSFNPSFGTTSRSFINSDNRKVQTTTYMFREDLKWDEFSDYIVKHFRNKDKVNFIQFASSDGSEAYTQIISLLEKHKANDKFFPIQAYDVDKENVRAAQSKLLNVHYSDHNAAKEHSIFLNKYLLATDKKLYFNNDIYINSSDDTKLDSVVKTYKVSPKLTSRVNFQQADMFDILMDLEDDSNTVLMCRNTLGHFSTHRFKEFIDLAAEKLKKGSILVIGSYDTMFIQNERYIQEKGFVKIMENVYRKQFNFKSTFASSK